MSEERDIKPNELVFNTVYYSSDEEDEDKNFEDINEGEELDYQSCDEEDEEKKELLEELLLEVANVDCISKNTFRIEFFDPNSIEFINEKEDCDFDLNSSGHPMLPDGGEDFFLPFIRQLIKKEKKFKKIMLETNVKGKKFTFK